MQENVEHAALEPGSLSGLRILVRHFLTAEARLGDAVSAGSREGESRCASHVHACLRLHGSESKERMSQLRIPIFLSVYCV